MFLKKKLHQNQAWKMTAFRFLGLAFSASIVLAPVQASSGASDRVPQTDMVPKRVAVIGAGSGGSSTAYHLAQYAEAAGIPTDITVYERANYIGGRTTTVNAWSSPSTPIELGGSIFVKVNHILYSAAQRFNLSSTEKLMVVADLPELGIWNGEEMILQTSKEDSWWDKAKLLWRYGLAPIYTNRLMKATVDKFLSFYEEPIFPFDNLSNAAYKVGLTTATAATGEQFLKENGIADKFAEEIIQASTRVNYAQNLGLIHGLETMVCMATDGAMAVEGGNWQIFANMLKSAQAEVKLNTTVQKIAKQPDNSYVLVTDSDSEPQIFDEVVLAAPLQFSSLVIDPAPAHVPDQIPYVNLHVTLFASPHLLSAKAFNIEPGKPVPQFIITTLPPGEHLGADPDGVGKPGFFSISVVAQARNPKSVPSGRTEYVYKIFSPKRVDTQFLSHILGRRLANSLDDDEAEQEADGAVTWIHRKLWQSYPYEYPRVTFDRIRLDDGLWYTSGIESFISTMETSALMGKNVAKLISNKWVYGDYGEGVAEIGEDLKTWKKEWDYLGLHDAGRQKPLKAKL